MMKYGRHIILLTLTLALTLPVLHAQQRLQHSQYLLNGFVTNPAIGGAENYLDLRTGFSQQWAGFEGAPRSLYFSANKALIPSEKTEKQQRITSLPIRGRGRANPTSELETVTVQRAGDPNFHMGVGGVLFSERSGPISYSGVSGAFAAHLRLKDELKLSVGAALELMNFRLDPSGIQLTDANDIAISQSTTSLMLPSFNAGFALYSRTFFITASSRQLLQNRIQLNPQNPVISGLEVHYIAQAGYRFKASENLNLVPSVALRYIQPAPPSFDLSLRADYKNLLFVGASYRHEDAVVAMLGINLAKKLQLNYAYDFTTSNLRNYSSGTHSIVLALRLTNAGTGGRRYFW